MEDEGVRAVPRYGFIFEFSRNLERVRKNVIDALSYFHLCSRVCTVYKLQKKVKNHKRHRSQQFPRNNFPS